MSLEEIEALRAEWGRWRDGYYAAKKHWEDAEATVTRLRAERDRLDHLAGQEASRGDMLLDDVARLTARVGVYHRALRAIRDEATDLDQAIAAARGAINTSGAQAEKEADWLTARVGALEARNARLGVLLAKAQPFVVVSAARMQAKGIVPQGAADLLVEIDAALGPAGQEGSGG